MDSLVDWTNSSIPGLRHFSGIATYRTSFKVEDQILKRFNSCKLDMGKIGEVARVYLNGEEVGISIFPPHRLDILPLIKAGENHLVIEVANTWLNRLIGDLELPLDQQYTRSNVAYGPDPKNRPWSEYELSASGLIGPVILRFDNSYTINTE
jgi:hypothetical protein